MSGRFLVEERGTFGNGMPPHYTRVVVTETDARNLVATLYADGSTDAMAAARTLVFSLERGDEVVWLTEPEQLAILCVLEDPPDTLAALRGELALDHRRRMNDFR